jgi:hypothetical protein
MQSPGSSAPPSRRQEWLALALLVGTVLFLHSHGLTFGFFLDDNNHLERCYKNGYAGLARGNTFEWNRNLVRVWWATKDMGWAYFRPLPVALRTTWLLLFGLDPLPFHIVHFLMYLAGILLFYGLLRRYGLPLAASLVGTLLFTLHPTHAQVAPWLANDACILTGFGFLSALWFLHLSATAAHRRPLFLAGVFGGYAVALLSRETGLMLGPILVLADWLLARQWPDRRRWFMYVALALEALIYLGARSLLLESAPIPGRPYFYWPTEAGFVGWLPYKLLSDFVGLTLGFPFVPIAVVPWFRARPVTTAVAVVAVLGVIVLFVAPLRRSRAVWGLLAGIALATAPTLLAFSAAYMYFLISAGWTALLAVWAAQTARRRPRLVAGSLSLLAVVYFVVQWAGVWQMRAMSYAEQCVRASILATDPACYPPRTKLFFLNMPLFATEVAPLLRMETGRDDLEVFALTYAPEPFAARRAADIHVEDDHTLLVRMDGAGWFPGIVGESLQLGWFGCTRDQLEPGPVIVQPAAGEMPFRVEVVEKGPEGFPALRFIFDQPLDSPYYRFFVGHRDRAAQPWHPDTHPFYRTTEPLLAVLNDRMQRVQMALEHVYRVFQACP